MEIARAKPTDYKLSLGYVVLDMAKNIGRDQVSIHGNQNI
jgi:hypothetical protein